MPEQWTAEIVGIMHMHHITAKQLSTQLGYNPKYVSSVLNSHPESQKGGRFGKHWMFLFSKKRMDNFSIAHSGKFSTWKKITVRFIRQRKAGRGLVEREISVGFLTKSIEVQTDRWPNMYGAKALLHGTTGISTLFAFGGTFLAVIIFEFCAAG